MTMPLFYQNPVPLDPEQHAGFSLPENFSYRFAASVNAVPVTLLELPNVMQVYPIAFAGDSPATPLAVLGLRDNENLFVNEDGEWIAGVYVPAYIRRYPFIFSREKGSKHLTLCIDDSPGVLLDSDQNPLFGAAGELTDLTAHALEFCKSYQAAAEQTDAFVAALEQNGVLTDSHAEIRLRDGEVLALTGFRQINEEKFLSLPDHVLPEWHRRGWTGAAYAQIFSTANWQRLFQLTQNRQEDEDIG